MPLNIGKSDKFKSFNLEKIRQDFPALSTKVYNKPLIYLDNAASAQKPQLVLDIMNDTYINAYANVHRGLHYRANEATIRYENARQKVTDWLGAKTSSNIIFTKGSTDAINLVATSFGSTLSAGDEIVLSIMEHHSNIVPWHFLRQKGIILKWIELDENGDLDLNSYKNALSHKTKLVAITHMSNVLGTITPLKEMTDMAHKIGAKVLADGSQYAAHNPVDVEDLGIDFYAITGHKIYAPTGIGVLYMTDEMQAILPPYQGGGEMIADVTKENVTYAEKNHKFEAGTPPIVQAIGLGAAIDYLQSLDLYKLHIHEKNLLQYATEKLKEIDVDIYGESKNKGSVISFNVKNLHAHDLATYIDRKGVAIRAGHHCCQPLMSYLKQNSTARASFAFYNIKEDIDILIDSIIAAKTFFA